MTDMPKFVLPGTWLRVDLASEATARSSIRKLVQTVVGNRDDRAQWRAELRGYFHAAADLAREVSTRELFVAQSIAQGVPLSASLSLSYPDLTSHELSELGLADLAQIFGILRTPEADVTDMPIGVSDGKIRAVRQISHHLVPASDDVPAIPRVQFDYWIARATPAQIVLFSFSSTFVDFEVELAELFDAVVRTARWPVVVK